MSAARKVPAAAVLIIGVGAVAGCGSSPDASVSVTLYQSPEQATLSWFSAINHRDKTAVVDHLTRAAAHRTGWGSVATSAWSTFSALHCKPAIRQSATSASVYCAFKESQSPSEGNPDSFWTVYLHRQPDGRWLITDYGQP
jgi:hypothetical protein